MSKRENRWWENHVENVCMYCITRNTSEKWNAKMILDGKFKLNIFNQIWTNKIIQEWSARGQQQEHKMCISSNRNGLFQSITTQENKIRQKFNPQIVKNKFKIQMMWWSDRTWMLGKNELQMVWKN